MEKSKKWYQSTSNWVIIVACIILIPILLMNIYIMIQSKRNQDEVPSVFGIKPFIVLSGSMETEIYKGDLILTKSIDAKTLKIKDVIAFRDAENTVTTHRIIDIIEKNGETYFITQGDNNKIQDQYLVELSDVEGLYIGRVPGIGSIMNKLSEPTTIVIIFFGVTIIFAIGFMISNKKSQEAEKREFLEYKRLKELEEKNKKELEKDDAIKEVKKALKKKTNNKKSTEKKQTEKSKAVASKSPKKASNSKKDTAKEEKTPKKKTTAKKSTKGSK